MKNNYNWKKKFKEKGEVLNLDSDLSHDSYKS